MHRAYQFIISSVRYMPYRMHFGTIAKPTNKCTHTLHSREPYTSWFADIYTLALQNNQPSASKQDNKNMYIVSHKKEARSHQKGTKSVSWKSRYIKHLKEPIEFAPVTVERIRLSTQQKPQIHGRMTDRKTYMRSLKERQIQCPKRGDDDHGGALLGTLNGGTNNEQKMKKMKSFNNNLMERNIHKHKHEHRQKREEENQPWYH